MSATYTIKLAQFEGPFDLLLFFIERDELDIHDIPIARITDDFLSYIHTMEKMNIDLASEFILVAATLCQIKAKMLLPRQPLDEEGNVIDPREELVQRLLEYKRYKSVLDDLRDMELRRGQQVERGNAAGELRKIANQALADQELESLTLFKLLRAYERALEQFKDRRPGQVHRIIPFNYTIEDQQVRILKKIRQQGRADFKAVFEACENRIHAIVTFLAMLEMINLEQISITDGEGVNNLWLEAA